MKITGALGPFFLFFTVLLTGCGVPFFSSGNDSATTEMTPLAAPVLPAATAPSNRDFVAYLNPQLGIALHHPPGWIIREGEPLLLASDSSLLKSTDGVLSGAILAVTPINLAAEDVDLTQALVEFVGSPEESRIIEPAAPLDVNGQEAAALTMISVDEAGIEFTTLFRLMRHQGATVLLSAVTPDHVTFQPLLETIMDSVIISAPLPTAAPPTLTPVPTPSPAPINLDEEGTPIPTAESAAEGELSESEALQAEVPSDFVQWADPQGRYTIGRPAAWLINDTEEDAVLLASSELLLNDNVFTEGGAAVWLFPQTLANGSDPDPVLVLEQFIANFPVYDTFEAVVPPRPLQINGQNGATSRYAATVGGAAVDAVYFTAVRDHHFVVLVAIVAADSIADLLPVVEGMAVTMTVNN